MQDSAEPILLTAFGGEKIIECVSSGKHALFLDEKGRVWVIGEGSNGEVCSFPPLRKSKQLTDVRI
jgi:hypothetical protein